MGTVLQCCVSTFMTYHSEDIKMKIPSICSTRNDRKRHCIIYDDICPHKIKQGICLYFAFVGRLYFYLKKEPFPLIVWLTLIMLHHMLVLLAPGLIRAVNELSRGRSSSYSTHYFNELSQAISLTNSEPKFLTWDWLVKLTS
jgi:hypothetical protein